MKKISIPDDNSLVITFKYPCVECELDASMYNKNDEKDVLYILNELTNEIKIDKTYVDFKGTKFSKTFISEAGWDRLCDTLRETGFGRRISVKKNNDLYEAYGLIILCYLYQCFSDLGYNVDGMQLFMRKYGKFTVEYSVDTSDEWRRYPGRWQDWPEWPETDGK